MSESSPTEVQRIEVITSVQRRRCWSVAEKIEIVEETEQPGMSVSCVARRYGAGEAGLGTILELRPQKDMVLDDLVHLHKFAACMAYEGSAWYGVNPCDCTSNYSGSFLRVNIGNTKTI